MRSGGANSSGSLKARKKGVRKKYKQKLVKPLPKMKIVVKSTKTISFDENYEEDDSSDHNEESADEISHQSPQEMQEYLKTATEEEEEKKVPSSGFGTVHEQASTTNNIQIISQNASDITSNAKGATTEEGIIPIESQQASSSDPSTSVILLAQTRGQVGDPGQNAAVKTTVTLGRLPKETIRLGGRSQRKQRQKQKKILGVVNNHSPLQEVKSEDEDEVEN